MAIPEAPKAADIFAKAKHVSVIAALIGIGFTSGVAIGGIKEIFRGFDDRVDFMESQFKSQSVRLNSHEVRIGVSEKLIEGNHGP